MNAPTATGRRVTPHAVRVLPADADRDIWLAARRDGIGASDVPAILGLIKQRTPLHVWYDKRGQLADDDNEYALWGRLLEAPIAAEWTRRNASVTTRIGLIAHHDHPWMLTTLDRKVAECPTRRGARSVCALEVKCRNAYPANRWHAEIPDDVLAQVAWQRMVTGYDHIHVAVLVGGNDYRQVTVGADQDIDRYVLDTVTAWRQRHLVDGHRPVVDDPDTAAARIALDERLHPDRIGEIDITDLGEVMHYARISAVASAADRALKTARAHLAELADGRRYVTCAGELAYQFTPTNRTKVDLDRLAEHWPDAYADVVRTETSNTIRLDKTLKHPRIDEESL